VLEKLLWGFLALLRDPDGLICVFWLNLRLVTRSGKSGRQLWVIGAI
jgi:hypothetical protein